jgi:hypothetical protein
MRIKKKISEANSSNIKTLGLEEYLKISKKNPPKKQPCKYEPKIEGLYRRGLNIVVKKSSKMKVCVKGIPFYQIEDSVVFISKTCGLLGMGHSLSKKEALELKHLLENYPNDSFEIGEVILDD